MSVAEATTGSYSLTNDGYKSDQELQKFGNLETAGEVEKKSATRAYWHPDINAQEIDMSSEKRNRTIVLASLAISVIVNIVCIVLLILAYTKIKSNCSNNNVGTCPAVQSFFVSGYDSSIVYNGSLAQAQSPYFLQQAANEVKCMTQNIQKAKFTPYFVKVSTFRAPPALPSATAAGAIFYGMVVLQGAPSSLPTTGALITALNISCGVVSSEQRKIRSVNAPAYEMFAVNTQPSALCQSLYVPPNFKPLPQTTTIPPPAPNTTAALVSSSSTQLLTTPAYATTVAPSSSTSVGPTGSAVTTTRASTTVNSSIPYSSTSVRPSQLCALDVIFILDQSQSVTQADFQMEKDFAINVVNQMVSTLGLPVGTGSMLSLQFAVETFADHGQVQFTLCNSTDQTSVRNNIKGISYSTSGLRIRNTAVALNNTLNQVLIGPACDRSQNPDLVILVTNGVHNPGSPNPIPIAQTIRAQQQAGVNTKIISVGVGLNGSNSGIFYQELVGISGNRNQVFNVTTYKGLLHVVSSLVNSLSSCSTPLPTTSVPGCTPSTQMNDIIFVFDDSSTMGQTGFKAVLQLMSQFVQSYTVSPKYTQFALVPFDTFSSIDALLNTYAKGNATANKIKLTQAIQYLSLGFFPGHDIFKALQQVENRVQQLSNGYRSASKKMLILISTAPWTGNNPISTAQAIRKSGLNIVAIGYGNHSNTNQLLGEVAGGPQCVTMAQTPAQLTNNALTWLNSVTCQLQKNSNICQ